MKSTMNDNRLNKSLEYIHVAETNSVLLDLHQSLNSLACPSARGYRVEGHVHVQRN